MTSTFILIESTKCTHVIQIQSLVDCCGLRLHETGSMHHFDVVKSCDIPLASSVEFNDVILTYNGRSSLPVAACRRRQLTKFCAGRGTYRTLMCIVTLRTSKTEPTGSVVWRHRWHRNNCNPWHRLMPSRWITRRPCPSDSWFDADCWNEKRITHRLENFSATDIKRTDCFSLLPMSLKSRVNGDVISDCFGQNVNSIGCGCWDQLRLAKRLRNIVSTKADKSNSVGMDILCQCPFCGWYKTHLQPLHLKSNFMFNVIRRILRQFLVLRI